MPTASESRVIAATPAQVWAAVTDLETAHRWNQAWHRVEYLSHHREGVGTSFRAHTEDGHAFDFRISEWAPGEYVAFVPLEEDEPEEHDYLLTLEAQAFHLEPAPDDMTRVTLLASASSHGLRGWFAARFIWPGFQRQGLRNALDALQDIFEPPEQDESEEPEEEE